MWLRHNKRDEVKARTVHAELPARIDQVLTTIRDGQPAVDSYQAILQAGVDLMQIPKDLAFVRIADCDTGATQVLTTLAGRFAQNVLVDKISGITGRAMRSGKPQLVPNVRKDED